MKNFIKTLVIACSVVYVGLTFFSCASSRNLAAIAYPYQNENDDEQYIKFIEYSGVNEIPYNVIEGGKKTNPINLVKDIQKLVAIHYFPKSDSHYAVRHEQELVDMVWLKVLKPKSKKKATLESELKLMRLSQSSSKENIYTIKNIYYLPKGPYTEYYY